MSGRVRKRLGVGRWAAVRVCAGRSERKGCDFNRSVASFKFSGCLAKSWRLKRYFAGDRIRAEGCGRARGRGRAGVRTGRARRQAWRLSSASAAAVDVGTCVGPLPLIPGDSKRDAPVSRGTPLALRCDPSARRPLRLVLGLEAAPTSSK